jgi:Glyoxalase/Bleomycin resistance protein/Dioxygenase superfamily
VSSTDEACQQAILTTKTKQRKQGNHRKENNMPDPLVFQSVHPIGETNILALPVKDIGPAVGYYTQVLGFRLVEKQSDKAVLQRDAVTIGLASNGSDPE